jgi:hypothetical protein
MATKLDYLPSDSADWTPEHMRRYQAAREARIKAERRAWLRDHPGKEYQEHECAMTERELRAYRRWLDSPREQARRKRLERRLKVFDWANATT